MKKITTYCDICKKQLGVTDEFDITYAVEEWKDEADCKTRTTPLEATICPQCAFEFLKEWLTENFENEKRNKMDVNLCWLKERFEATIKP